VLEKQQRGYHASIVSKHAAIVAEHRAKLEQLVDELTTMGEAGEGYEGNNEIEHRSNKRRDGRDCGVGRNDNWSYSRRRYW
jgi:hypothetical protein